MLYGFIHPHLCEEGNGGMKMSEETFMGAKDVWLERQQKRQRPGYYYL